MGLENGHVVSWKFGTPLPELGGGRMSNCDLSEFGSEAPREEEILFPRRSVAEQQADMTQGLEGWVYSTGFRLAARQLANQVSNAEHENAFMVYPIVYLYRHYFELVLKEIIKSAVRLLDRELTEQLLKTLGHHGLSELWQVTLPLLGPVCERASTPPFPATELEGVTSYIRQLHEHDPDGQRFRYATRKSKRATPFGSAAASSLSPNLNLANVREFAIAMERLADYLGGIEGWFAELEDAKAEIGLR